MARNPALSPKRFAVLRDLVAQGMSAADIAVNLSIDVTTATEWKLVLDGPGALDAVVERDAQGVRAAVGTTDIPDREPSAGPGDDEPAEPSPASSRDRELAGALGLPRTFLARRIRRGRYDHLLEQIQAGEAGGRNRKRVIEALHQRREALEAARV